MRRETIFAGRNEPVTSIAIHPILTEKGNLSYQGNVGDIRSEGSTPGEALDALTRQSSGDKMRAGAALLVIVQGLHPDPFFDAIQQHRLAELMDEWRSANDCGQTLHPNKQAELDALVEAELRASTQRATSLADDFRP